MYKAFATESRRCRDPNLDRDPLFAFTITRVKGVRLIAIEEVIKKYIQNYGKNVYIKNMFENGWWEDGYTHHPTTPLIHPWPKATETIKKVWHILVTWHHEFCSFLLKGRVKREGRHGTTAPSKYAPDNCVKKLKNMQLFFRKYNFKANLSNSKTKSVHTFFILYISLIV